MSAQVRRRKQVSLPFSTNNKVTDKLSRGMLYRSLMLRLTGAPTLTGANNTLAKTLAGDEWGVVKKIEIIANGSDVVRTYSGLDLWMINYFTSKVPPRVTAALGDGSTANVPFNSLLRLPFWSPDTFRPMDTVLDARNMAALEIAVTWGTFTDINADATAWTTTPVLDVWSEECFNVAGKFAVLRHYPIQGTITASNPALRIPLTVGPMYRGFLMQFRDAGVDSSAILNNFKLTAGGVNFVDLPGSVLRESERLAKGRLNVFSSAAGTPAYEKLMKSAKFVQEGWYWYDHLSDGYLMESIDTLGFTEFNIELDVTVGGGTTDYRIIPYEVNPVRDKAKVAA